MTKKIAVPKTRLTANHRDGIIRKFTEAFALKQADRNEISALVSDFITSIYNLTYDTPEKKAAVKTLIDAGLYKTSVTTRLSDVICDIGGFKTDVGLEKFLDLQRSYGLQFTCQQTVPLLSYADFKVVEFPEDLIERAMTTPKMNMAPEIVKLRIDLEASLKIKGEVLETYGAVCGMIKAARTAEDLITLLPEIAPVIVSVVSLVQAKDIVVAPTIEMREILASLVPIEVGDIK